MRKILSYFLQGLILFIPLIITLFLLFKMFDIISSWFSVFGLSESLMLNTLFGIVLTFGFIALLGALASSFILKNLFNAIEDKLEHAPFIRHIYSPVKDFTNAFVGNKKKFNKPVLVLTNPQANIEEIGFITQEDLSDLGIQNKVAVYMPLSYSLSGKIFIVPISQIKAIDKEASEVMKFVVSGGVTDVD
jgi:uncharacterized membrane protein